MKTKFTKGPWSVWNQFMVVIGDNINSRVSTKNTGAVDSPVPEREANARLIAAAPEMYEMLEFIGENPSETNVIHIRRLLTKARGEL